MKAFVHWSLALAITILPGAIHAGDSWTLSAAVERSPDGQHILNMKLKNGTSEQVAIYKSDLPWSSPYSMQLLAIRLGSIPPYEQLPIGILPAISVSPDTLIFDPGQTASGHILLDYRFPSLTTDLRRFDVLLFYSYKLHTVRGGQILSGQRLSGAVTIEKWSPISRPESIE